MEQYLDLFYKYFLPILITAGAGILLYLIRGLVKKYGTKLGVETQNKLSELIGTSVAQGVAFAEQWAKARQKELGDNLKVSSQDKLAKAIEFVLVDLKRSGIIDVAEKVIRDKIEACLGFNTIMANDAAKIASETITELEDDNESPNFPDTN